MISLIERLGQHTGFADNGNEVGVATPTGHDVHVQMFGNTSASHGAQVHANIETLWMIDLAKQFYRLGGQLHQFGLDMSVECGERVGVKARHNHQMPAGVGVEVKDDVGIFPAMEDEIVSGVLAFQGFAKGTSFERLVTIEVFHAPGAAHGLHGVILS